MIISDLTYLENISEDINVEGAGYADFFITRSVNITAQRLAYGFLDETLDVGADAVKFVNYTQSLSATAEV